jgi:hypothetical protein
MALFHLLLMLSGDIEVNPGPKTNRRTAKSRFVFDLNTDASLAHSDPKRIGYKISYRKVWLISAHAY